MIFSVISSKFKVKLGVILLRISDNLLKSYNIIKSLSYDFTYLMLAAKSFIINIGDRNYLLTSGWESLVGCFDLRCSQCCRRMKKNVLKVINELSNISVCIFNPIFTCKNVNLYYINCIVFKLVIKCENMINKRQLNITTSLFIELLLAWLCIINETKKHQVHFLAKNVKKEESPTSNTNNEMNIKSERVEKIVKISNAMIKLLTIYLMLICQGIEEHPGPPKKYEIITYNCNGLRDRNKLKRLLGKLNKTVSNGAIVFLQETHIVNTDYLKLIWKNKFLSNCNRTNSAGVIILFSDKYEIQCSHDDNDGRHTIAVLKNEEETIIVSNVYFPNDHREGIAFAEKVYLKYLNCSTNFQTVIQSVQVILMCVWKRKTQLEEIRHRMRFY